MQLCRPYQDRLRAVVAWYLERRNFKLRRSFVNFVHATRLYILEWVMGIGEWGTLFERRLRAVIAASLNASHITRVCL